MIFFYYLLHLEQLCAVLKCTVDGGASKWREREREGGE